MATAFATSVFFLLLIALPAIAGVVLIVHSRRRGKGYPACGQCGYDVTGTLGTPNARCPECGGDFGMVGILPPGPQTRRAPLIFGILLIVIPLTCIGAAVLWPLVSYQRASQAAQAAAIRQRALAAQQAMFASQPPDSALVESFRPKVAGLSVIDASARLAAITQELAQRQVNQSLDADLAANLRAEFEALAEHLNSQQAPTPGNP